MKAVLTMFSAVLLAAAAMAAETVAPAGITDWVFTGKSLSYKNGIGIFNGYMLSACVCRGLHNLTDRLCDSAMAPDNHTCITFGNGEDEFYVITINVFDYINRVGIVNNGASNIGKYLLELH